jgi:hypothetical protein
VFSGVKARANAALALTLFALATLALHPESRFYLPCPIHEYLGLLCPGCGATRALAALLRGHLTTAWHANPLLVCALPLLIAYAATAYARAIRSETFAWPQIPLRFMQIGLGIAGIFVIARNL